MGCFGRASARRKGCAVATLFALSALFSPVAGQGDVLTQGFTGSTGGFNPMASPPPSPLPVPISSPPTSPAPVSSPPAPALAPVPSPPALPSAPLPSPPAPQAAVVEAPPAPPSSPPPKAKMPPPFPLPPPPPKVVLLPQPLIAARAAPLLSPPPAPAAIVAPLKTAPPAIPATPALTAAPTPAPTLAPRILPAPTIQPVVTPAPTAAPTPLPTTVRSPAPTKAPAVAALTRLPYARRMPPPLQLPARLPMPTFVRTPAPTKQPAALTKAAPSTPAKAPLVAARTQAPTAAPTPAPTKAPTRAPTAAPTAVPTKAPTKAPTAAPLAAAAPVLPGLAPAPQPGGFMRAVNAKFVDSNCNNFIPFGWNAWHLIETITGSAAQPDRGVVPPGELFLDYTFSTAKNAGFNTFRFFALGDNDDNRNSPYRTQYALQPAPGQYNETIFRAIDTVLAFAAMHELQVIVTLIDNWKLIDGAPQYIEWCTGVAPSNDSSSFNDIDMTPFWSNPQCQQLYKNHVRKVLNRQNTVNGRIYKNDPTIFAWDLYNEPRCQSPCYAKVQPWIQMMASFFKSIDSNHMLTVGEEGFFGPSSPQVTSNPVQGQTWPQETGQDFTTNHASPDVDFAAIHLWPDRWTETDPSFAQQWLSAHIQAATALGKPLLLEEFGKLMPRDAFYQAVFDAVEAADVADNALQGAMFWLFQSYSSGANATASGNIDRVDYGVVPSDSTWGLTKGAATRIAARQPLKVAGCTVGGSGPVPQSTTGPGAVAG